MKSENHHFRLTKIVISIVLFLAWIALQFWPLGVKRIGSLNGVFPNKITTRGDVETNAIGFPTTAGNCWITSVSRSYSINDWNYFGANLLIGGLLIWPALEVCFRFLLTDKSFSISSLLLFIAAIGITLQVMKFQFVKILFPNDNAILNSLGYNTFPSVVGYFLVFLFTCSAFYMLEKAWICLNDLKKQIEVSFSDEWHFRGKP